MRFRISTSLAVGVACAQFLSPPAWAAGSYTLQNSLDDAVKQAKQVGEMQCAEQTSHASCMTCKSKVESWKTKILELAKKYGSNDAAISGTAAASTAATAGALKANQANSQGGAQTTVNTGNAGKNDLASNANSASGELAQCVKQVTDACKAGMPDSDRAQAEKMQQACLAGQKAAKDYANNQSKDGMDMGQLGQLLGAAGQMMGAMMNKPQASGMDPNASTANAPQIQTSSLGDPSKTGDSPVGFGMGSGASMDPNSAGAGGAQASNESGGSGVTPASSGFGGSADAANGGGTGASAATASPGGGGGSAAMGNSTGASSAPTDAAAAPGAKGDSYDANFGGGGGRGMVGLRPAKMDLDSPVDGALASDSPLKGLGGDLDRVPASDSSTAGANDSADDGDSIFARVKMKYGLLKVAGKI